MALVDDVRKDTHITSLRSTGAPLPRRPMGEPITIPLDASLVDCAELRLPAGTTDAELRKVVRYIDTLLIGTGGDDAPR